MKKIFACMVSVFIIGLSMTSIFAFDDNYIAGYKYVKDLGYEVSVGQEYPMPNVNITTFFGIGYEIDQWKKDRLYDSGWKDFLGGKWRHGVGNKYVWSHFDHNKKVHKTTVRGAGNKMGYSGWTDAGEEASAAWERAAWGNKAWADVK